MKKRMVIVGEIISAVCEDMRQLAMSRGRDFPFEEEAKEIQRRLFTEYPGIPIAIEKCDESFMKEISQKCVSEGLRDAYIALFKKVQQWEKESGQESVIQFQRAD